MPTKVSGDPQQAEKDKYKAKVRKNFNFAKGVDTEKVLELMWLRESDKRDAAIEKGIDRFMEAKGKKKKEIEDKPGMSEQVAPGFWRDVPRSNRKAPINPYPGKKKLGWI